LFSVESPTPKSDESWGRVKPIVVAIRTASRETRLCISLPFLISFIANIARKRPELNRDKTKSLWQVPKKRCIYILR
jgi:hypothetical protein